MCTFVYYTKFEAGQDVLKSKFSFTDFLFTQTMEIKVFCTNRFQCKHHVQRLILEIIKHYSY